MFFLIINIVIYFLLFKKKKSYLFLGVGFLSVILHSIFLFIQTGEAFIGSDTLFYYENAKLLNNGFSNISNNYLGYSLLNLFFTYPFTGNIPFFDALLIRLNNLFLWAIVLGLLLGNKKNIFYSIIRLVAIWYSLFNIRDGFIAILLLLIFAILLKKTTFILRFLKVLPLFLTLSFFRLQIIAYLIMSIVIVRFVFFISFILNQKPNLGKIVVIASMAFFLSWSLVKIPLWSTPFFLRMLTVKKSDQNRHNSSNENFGKLILSNPQSVGQIMGSRYLKRLPTTIYRGNPLKGILYDINEFNPEAPIRTSLISLFYNFLLHISYYFLIIPLFFSIVFIQKNYKDLSIYYWLFTSLFLFLMVNGIYSLKFGSTQNRIIWIQLIPLLYIVEKIELSKNSIIVIKITSLCCMFLLMMVYFVIKPM